MKPYCDQIKDKAIETFLRSDPLEKFKFKLKKIFVISKHEHTVNMAKSHFSQNDTLARDTLAGTLGQIDSLARVTFWPETLWPETVWLERQFGQ